MELTLDDTGLGGWEGLLLPDGDGLGTFGITGVLEFDVPELVFKGPEVAVEGC